MSEPVAYRVGKELCRMLCQAEIQSSHQRLPIEPLYTHPAKALADKEILELWDWDSGEILATDLLDFADAILRKAQE